MLDFHAPEPLNMYVGLCLSGLLVAAGCSKGPTPAPEPSSSEEPPFENPGGMWMPSQLGDHQTTLEKLGLAFSPNSLTDPSAFPLGAAVNLDGCSASFVSPEGLIITNHHCVTRALQRHSTPEHNRLIDGFIASERDQELSLGPRSVFVTTGFVDVTEAMTTGLDAIDDGYGRAQELDRRRAAQVSACEAQKPTMHCTVASYFDGAQYIQIEALELEDVRLVYAPHSGVGVFGGEVDNWRWPRHTGDFSFLRAYVGSDGQPAPYSPDNIPYTPPHHFTVSTSPLTEGDFAMVTGYPGRTYRLKTAAEVQAAVDWYYPNKIAQYDQYIALYEALGQSDPELAIKSASRLRGLANYRTNFQGMLDGLQTGGLAMAKAEHEAKLQRWIEADPTRSAQFGSVLAEMAALQTPAQERRDFDAAVAELVAASRLLSVALTLRDLAAEREKPEADRRPGFSDAQLVELKQELIEEGSQYDPRLDRAVLKLAIQRTASLPEGKRPDVMLEALLGRAFTIPLDESALDAALGTIYERTKLGDPAVLARLLTASLKSLNRSRDPMLKAASSIELIVDDMERRATELEGAMSAIRPTYIAALRAFDPNPLAPDANGTLRVTYGTVRGYKPSPDAEPYTPFTTVGQMLAKHTGEPPFNAPSAVVTAAGAQNFGPYKDSRLGDLPVNFLTDLDITGGNSGSATLNARGELIGLAFDGNYEAMASDWLFMPALSRTIHVDVRYILWIMDAVDGVDHLLTEMGVTPSLESPESAGTPSVADELTQPSDSIAGSP